MKKQSKQAKEPEVVELPVEEKFPEPEKVEVPLFNSNQLRVIFPKLPVKKIVSYHSGTILADPEPIIELSDDKYQVVLQQFLSSSNDGVLSTSSLVDVVARIIFPSAAEPENSSLVDRELLQNIVDEKLLQCLREFPDSSSSRPDNSSYDNQSSDQNLPAPPLSSSTSINFPSVLNQQLFFLFFLKFFAPSFDYGQRLRMYCGRGEKNEIQKLIYRGCSINSANGEGLTPLHYAAENNQVEVIDFLYYLSFEAKVTSPLLVNAQDKYGWAPLHCCSFNGHLQAVAKLLAYKSKIDVSIVNNVGKSPLHLACAQNRTLIVNHLLNAGCSLSLQDSKGMTPLHEAAFRGRINLFQELVRDPRARVEIRDSMNRLAGDYLSEEPVRSESPPHLLEDSVSMRNKK
jgi:ankyrin repeat protein